MQSIIDALLANFQNQFYNNFFPNINLPKKIIKEAIQLSQVKIMTSIEITVRLANHLTK